jgi:hypothetical protein
MATTGRLTTPPGARLPRQVKPHTHTHQRSQQITGGMGVLQWLGLSHLEFQIHILSNGSRRQVGPAASVFLPAPTRHVP